MTKLRVILGSWFTRDRRAPVIMSFASLAGIYINLQLIRSPVIGAFAFLVYLCSTTCLVEHIFSYTVFREYRLMNSFFVTIAMITVVSYALYFVYKFTDMAMVVAAGITTAIFALMADWGEHRSRSLSCFTEFFIKMFGQFKHFSVMDGIFLTASAASFGVLLIARTGESILNPWAVVHPVFFAFYFIACLCLVLLILTKPKNTAKLLTYSIILFLIPSSIYLIVLKHSYATPAIGTHIGWGLRITEYGGYISNPDVPEHPGGFIRKNYAQTGWHLLVVLLSEFLQVPVKTISITLIPLIVSIFVPFFSFQMMRVIAPRNFFLAPLVAFSFLFSQHNIFTLLPPGKPETLALVFVYASISMFAVEMKQHHLPISKHLPKLILLIVLSSVLFHPGVGMIAILVLLSMIVTKRYLPFGNRRYIIVQGGVCVTIIALYFFLHKLAIAVGYLGPNYAFIMPDSLSLKILIKALFLDLHFIPGPQLYDTILSLYLNNFTYLLYALFVIGAVYWFKRGFDRKVLAQIVVISLTLLVMMMIQRIFYPGIAWERYRFLYYMGFLSIPVIGMGFYAVANVRLPRRLSRYRIFLHAKLSKGSIVLTRRNIPAVGLAILIMASSVTAALYGGYPRPHSLGPYWGVEPSYPSDYDVEAMHFILRSEVGNDYGFYIVGDLFTAAAGVAEMGVRTIWYNNVSIPIYSFLASRVWPHDVLWRVLVSEWPGKSLPIILNVTGNLVNHTYLIFTYRLGEERLGNLSQSYADFLGPPVFCYPRKIYVFLLKSSLLESRTAPIGTWQIGLLCEGDIGVQFEKAESGVRIQTVKGGVHQRFTLQHIYEPSVHPKLVVGQNWTNKRFFVLHLNGTAPSLVFSITVIGAPGLPHTLRYLVCTSVEGRQTIIIPFEYFEANQFSLSQVGWVWLQFHNPQPGINIEIGYECAG